MTVKVTPHRDASPRRVGTHTNVTADSVSDNMCSLKRFMSAMESAQAQDNAREALELTGGSEEYAVALEKEVCLGSAMDMDGEAERCSGGKDDCPGPCKTAANELAACKLMTLVTPCHQAVFGVIGNFTPQWECRSAEIVGTSAQSVDTHTTLHRERRHALIVDVETKSGFRSARKTR